MITSCFLLNVRLRLQWLKLPSIHCGSFGKRVVHAATEIFDEVSQDCPEQKSSSGERVGLEYEIIFEDQYQ